MHKNLIEDSLGDGSTVDGYRIHPCSFWGPVGPLSASFGSLQVFYETGERSPLSFLRSSQKTSTVLLRDLHKYRSTVLVTKTVLVTILLVIEALVLHKKFYYYILHTHMRSLKLAKKTKMFLGLCDEHLRLNENYATMFDFR